ncbi:hypothetical protein [Candidatus Reidiella endopervernicosa]|uniref:Uncharacterized protein n=1 Tax=Candidatus Reidiella endopervernicosa TaxID=2738883 RepID=A0A6N0HRU8_9GAMM|nr:hypothetical protein [Candidatus Reidiella endopervernicosa]QKQ25074.1 hypothetical protein HUE57_01330 [Candidatus Reidiella endopervernicosa]
MSSPHLKDLALFRTPLWRLYLFIVLSSVIFLAAVSYYKWLDIKKETQIETTYLHKLLQQSSHDQFLQQAAMLRIFGHRLVDIGVFENRIKAQLLMDELLEENPVFVAYGLANPQGQLILTR